MANLPRNYSGSEAELSSIPNNDKLSLIVTECSSTSFSEVYLSHSVMTKHLFYDGVSKVLLGKDGLRTASTFRSDPAPNDDEAVPDDNIKINSVIRAKLGVSVGDLVTILKNERIPHGEKVCVCPFENCPGDLESVNLLEEYLRPYFKGADRPVHIGDVFHYARNGKRIMFQITNVVPPPFCTVVSGTSITCRSFNLEEFKTMKSIREAPSVPIKEEPEEPELEITFENVVRPAQAPVFMLIKVPPIMESSANIGRAKNRTTDKALEQSDNRSGPSSGNNNIHNVTLNSSEGNARSSCQIEEVADPLKRKHSGEMDQATTNSRKSPKINAPVSTTTTNDGNDDDWGWESQGSGGGGSRSLVSTLVTGKPMSISQKDEDDWDSSASGNSSIQATASGRSRSVSTTTMSNHGDWGPSGGIEREGQRRGGSHSDYSCRQNSVNSNNGRWNNSIGTGGRGFTGKGGRGWDSRPFSSAYDGRNRDRGNRGSIFLPNNDNRPGWGGGNNSYFGSGGGHRDSYGRRNCVRGKRADRGGGGGRGGCEYGGQGAN